MGNVTTPRGKHSVAVPTSTTVEQRVDETELDFGCEEAVVEGTLQRMEETELPEELRGIVDTYQRTLGDRNVHQWTWLYVIFGEVTLSCVPDENAETVRELKTLLSMYNVLLDDLAEEYDDSTTFWELAKVCYPGSDPNWDHPDIDREYAAVGEEVWTAIEAKFDRAPRYDEFAEQFEFEFRQAMESMEYSRLTMDYEGIANLTETWLYGPHNMMIHAFGDVDLMFSPSFSREDYGEVREAMLTFQQMWRISNWVATWEREVRECDYSAGVVVAALEAGVVDRDMLDELEAGELDPAYVIERIRAAGIEEQFLADWQRRRDELRDRDFDVETVDLDAFIDGMNLQMKCRLASRGKMKETDE